MSTVLFLMSCTLKHITVGISIITLTLYKQGDEKLGQLCELKCCFVYKACDEFLKLKDSFMDTTGCSLISKPKEFVDKSS